MTVRLIDVGMDDDFTRYVDAIELTIQSFLTRTTYDDEPKKVELDTVRTRDIHIGVAALLGKATVLHVNAHGSNQEGSLGWFSDDDATEWLLDDLNHLCDEQGRGIGAPILISDCCNGARRRFTNGVQRLLAENCLYIAASRTISWSESTTFGTAFYAALLARYRGQSSVMARAKEAADAAISAYEAILNKECPYRVQHHDPR